MRFFEESLERHLRQRTSAIESRLTRPRSHGPPSLESLFSVDSNDRCELEIELQAKINTLNTEQKAAFDLCLNHFMEGTAAQPLQLIVSGEGGTGKSYLIDAIQSLGLIAAAGSGQQQQSQACGICAPIALLAPTGCAAFLISGTTIHTGLRSSISSSENFETPGDSTLLKLRREWAGVKMVIIDEMSMISLETLAAIDQRLKAITGKHDQSFGGLSVVLCGDLYQLMPVKGRTLYAGENDTRNDKKKSARMLWQSTFR